MSPRTQFLYNGNKGFGFEFTVQSDYYQYQMQKNSYKKNKINIVQTFSV